MVRVHPVEPPRRRRKRSLFARSAIAVIACALLASCAFAATLALSSAARGRLFELTGATQTSTAVASLALAPARYLRARLSPATPAKISLDMKFKYVHRIHEQRRAALESGELTTSDADFQPATIDLAGVTSPAKVRLTGERAKLLLGEKWPLRVRLRGAAHVDGIRRFELRNPHSSNFEATHLFFEHLRREDIVAPRARIADVVWNGKQIGLMTLEETASAELLESQQRRDAPMLRIAVERGNEDVENPSTLGSKEWSLEVLRPETVAASKRLDRNRELAEKLLRAHLDGTLSVDETFDAELWGRYLALVEIWAARDALQWTNLRLYWNPMTARFEPFGHVSDRPATAPDAARTAGTEPPFRVRLLANPRVHAAYARARTRIANEMRAPSFAADWTLLEEHLQRLIHREYPYRVAFDLPAVLARAEAVARESLPPPPSAPVHAALVAYRTKSPLPYGDVEKTLEQHPFLTFDAEAREFRAPPGRHDVDGYLTLPEQTGLRLAAGTTLHFEADRGILARGPLVFLGTESEPIVLEGPPGTKRSDLWSGVYVIDSAQPSRWTHVVVRNTAGFKRRGWELASGVVFRRTQFELEDCRFLGTSSEDALSAVRSTFAIRNVTILDSLSDGFDADHSSGSLDAGRIERAGGDAIDFGGAVAEVRNMRLANVRDKAIAVGERSRLIAQFLSIAHVGIGIASKNGSYTEISDSTFRDIDDVALVAYVNRVEFGPGTLIATGNDIRNADLVALAQVGSRIVVDGTEQRPIEAAVDRLYKDGENER